MTEFTPFEQSAETLDSPMAIVTTRAGNQTDGCLVGFATQCSIDPLRYLVCLSVENRTYELALQATTLAVHMLHDNPRDRELARHFGEETGGVASILIVRSALDQMINHLIRARA